MPGEIVMNRAAVRGIGADKLLALNAQYGGSNANKPKYSNNIQFAADGGMIGGFGRVMSPRTGGKNQWANRGARSIFQMFGMNIPGTEKSANYSQNDIGRYNKLNRNRQIQTGYAWNSNPLSSGYYGMSPTIKTTSTTPTTPRIPSSIPTAAKTPVNREKAIQSSVENARQLRNILKYIPFTGGYRDVLKNAEDLGTNDLKYNQKLNKQINQILGSAGGGLIKENTGMNISRTADRQLTALQPGEYVLPVDTVSKLGVSLIDKFVAMTDNNSTAAKLGKRSSRYMPGPLSRAGRGGMMTLPPINQSAGGSMGAPASGTSIPSFSAVSPSAGAERSMNASIYGIVG